MQNFPFTGFITPHCGQRNSIDAPHSIQNLALSGLSIWHFGHFTFLAFWINMIAGTGN
jgi:hypothetical protein